MSSTKAEVEEFWNAASCGENAYAHGRDFAEQMDAQATARYALEPFIEQFANFEDARGKAVLEVGVGMGSDHEQFAIRKPARLCGVDLTPRAIDFTSRRLALRGLSSELKQADAENLPFPDATFDIVYSWGVLHHTPNTQRGFSEVARVLKPGGTARIMVYHTVSVTGLMLWLRYSLLRRKLYSMADIYSTYLESPGTKAYSIKQAGEMAARAGFRNCHTSVKLSPGDLLEGGVGQRHKGPLLQLAKAIWPRRLLRLVPSLGLYLLIEAQRDH